MAPWGLARHLYLLRHLPDPHAQILFSFLFPDRRLARYSLAMSAQYRRMPSAIHYGNRLNGGASTHAKYYVRKSAYNNCCLACYPG